MSLLAHEQPLDAPYQPDRHSGPQDRDRQAPVAELFSRGNYAALALAGPPDDWQTHAALGLIGKTEEALEGLGRFPGEETAFYAAVARWIDGGEDDCIPGLLEPLQLPHAQNLLALLRKPRIEVLAQWPSVRAGCSDLLSGARDDPRFAVRNVSFHPEDLPNRPYADVHHFYDRQQPPDFYACAMVEWHLIPPNLHQLPCPLLGQTGDYDLHIQAVYPWLQLFDELIVTDPSEWNDVIRLAPAPVSTFPKSFVLPAGFPPLQPTNREVDVYLSGSVVHPYHLDKGELLGQLLAIPDLRVHLLNGFKAPQEYYRHLSNAKLSITYVRHPQALPTRGLESLAMGCATVVQRGSVLTLFVGANDGVLEYDLTAGDLPQRIRQIIENWPEFEKRAQRGASRIRDQFRASRVASQYLRFLTFLAARPRGRRAGPTTPRVQKRMILEKGWLPSSDLVGSQLLRELAFRNYEQLRRAIEQGPASPHPLIDAARESVLANHHPLQVGWIPPQEWLTAVRCLYIRAQTLFPRSLVPRFNHIRVTLHFGTPNTVGEALELLDQTLDLPEDRWEVDVLEDVFPWDFFPHLFNYRHYFDLVLRHLTQGVPVGPALCRLMRASLYAYRGLFPAHNGFYSRSLDDYRQASELDPSFPYYRLCWASQLIERGLTEDYKEARRLLTQLVGGSVPLFEAIELLKHLHERQAKQIEELERRRAYHSSLGALAEAALLRRQIDVQESWQTQEIEKVLPRSRLQIDVLEKVGLAPFHASRLRPERSSATAKSKEVESPISVLPTGLPAQLQAKQQEVDHLKAVIRAMEKSKLWLARKAWVRVKRLVLGRE